jgi:hypothetical protein
LVSTQDPTQRVADSTEAGLRGVRKQFRAVRGLRLQVSQCVRVEPQVSADYWRESDFGGVLSGALAHAIDRVVITRGE